MGAAQPACVCLPEAEPKYEQPKRLACENPGPASTVLLSSSFMDHSLSTSGRYWGPLGLQPACFHVLQTLKEAGAIMVPSWTELWLTAPCRLLCRATARLLAETRCFSQARLPVWAISHSMSLRAGMGRRSGGREGR